MTVRLRWCGRGHGCLMPSHAIASPQLMRLMVGMATEMARASHTNLAPPHDLVTARAQTRAYQPAVALVTVVREVRCGARSIWHGTLK